MEQEPQQSQCMCPGPPGLEVRMARIRAADVEAVACSLPLLA